MLKSCKYCGRIHPKGYVCPKKPKIEHRRSSKAALFRKSNAWKEKSLSIRHRDFSMCRICNDASYGILCIPGLETLLHVHHIEPLEECFERRLDDDNLVTSCTGHHEMAERGEIPRDYLHTLAVTSPRWG